MVLSLNNDDNQFTLLSADTVLGLGGDDTLTTFFGPAGSLIYGNTGDDTLTGLAQNDTLHGGQGDDTVRATDSNGLLSGDKNSDTLIAEDSNSTLYGGVFPDFIVGTDTSDGNDSLVASGGSNLLYGNAGNDTLVASGSDAGNDTLRGGKDNDFLLGSDGVTAGNVLFSGDKGNDTLAYFGNGGNITLFGGIFGGEPFGGNDNDSLYVAVGTTDSNNLLYGNEGNDTLVSDGVEDTLFAGKDNDFLVGSSGSLLYGGLGTDTIALYGTGSYAFGGNGVGVGESGDSLYSAGGFNYLYGWSGDDIVWGDAPWPDTLYGDGGNDSIGFSLPSSASGTSGNYWASGGQDDDTIVFEASSSSFTGTDALTSIGMGFGGGGDDSLYAAEFGTDEACLPVSLSGGSDMDTLVGSPCNDTLDGGEGNDRLFGLGDNDILRGVGSGRDTLTGGSGNDSFFISETIEGGTEVTGAAADRITDFATGDRIFLGTDFAGAAGTDIAQYNFAAGPNINATGINEIAVNTTNGNVFIDGFQSGTIPILVVDGASALALSDFSFF